MLGKLGHGSTASVFRAHDPFRNIEVAIKLFDPRVFAAADGELARNGFQVEAALLGKLDHPHVVRVFDVSTGPDDFYVVSEYVPGGTLADYTARGKLMDIESAIDVIYKCVKALQYLHANGVIHRDIKPENIFVGDGTDVKLGDFGAAMVSGLSISQRVEIGSPFYMSPQRLQGDEADVQSDIFSVGVLFYQLITGRRPFDANSIAALAYQMQSVEPAAASSIRHEVPVDVDRILVRAMSPALAARYATWEPFANDLSALFRTRDGRIRHELLVAASGRFEVLRQLSFFVTFTAIELWEVVNQSEFKHVVEGNVLMHENEQGAEFLVLVEGSVRIVKGSKVIDIVQAPSTLGEIAYVLKGNVPRNASVVAIEDGLVLHMSLAGAARLSSNCRSKLERRFLEILALRLIDTSRRLSHN